MHHVPHGCPSARRRHKYDHSAAIELQNTTTARPYAKNPYEDNLAVLTIREKSVTAGRGTVCRDSRARRPDAAAERKRGPLTAAVEVSPAPSRAQRRAGALHGGRLDVTPPRRRNAGDGGLDARHFRAGHRTAQAVRPARPVATGPQRRSRREGRKQTT